ncbi:MAG: hypothetical protein NC416_16665, partial [Eubacterium sp.]|nr:hypothetical protein [Eubacterium sp.]
EQIIEKNKMHQIEIRLRCSKETAAKLKNVSNTGIYGTLGNGEYTILLQYAEFAKAYPVYWRLKEGICQDEEMPELELSDSTLGGVLAAARNDIELVYERWNICCSDIMVETEGENVTANQWDMKRKRLKKRSDLCEFMGTAVNKLLKKTLERLVKNNPNFPEQRFREQVILMKDLLYTYNTLWYDETTLFKGRIFYAQMSALLSGIEQQTNIIKEYVAKSSGSESRGRGRTLYNLNNDLVVYMNSMISAINNFNKLAQAVNQSVRNVPNYEMQSKVNVEKYIYAYTSYLMEICQGFSKAAVGQKRVFPLMTIDLSVQKIQANTLFFVPWTLKRDEEKNYMNVFAVRCPNYQRFANVYHVLPMITHEISHCFRYIPREERNEFIIEYLPGSIAWELATGLFRKEFKAEEYIVKDDVLDVVYQCTKDELVKFLKEELKDSLGEIRLHNLQKVCLEKIAGYLGIDIRYEVSEGRLWEESNRILLELFRYLRIMYVTPQMISEDAGRYAAYIIPNIVLDILSGDKERVNQWETVISSGCLKEISFADMQDKITKILQGCVQTGNTSVVTYDAVKYCMQFMVYSMWKGFCEDHPQIKNIIGEGTVCRKLMEEFHKNIFERQTEQKSVEERLLKEMEKCHIDENTKMCLQKHLWETSGYIHELLKQWIVYGGKKITKRESKIDEYGTAVHKSLKGKFEEKILCLRENPWIATHRMESAIANLGILKDGSDQFTKRLKEQLKTVNLSHLEDLMRDRMRLYEEVFADLGMCCSFSFSAFGYFAYTIHLFLKERELPESIAHNMTADRMRHVIETLWSYDYYREDNFEEDDTEKRKVFYEEKVGELKNDINEYWEILKEKCPIVARTALAGRETAALGTGEFANAIKKASDYIKGLSNDIPNRREVLMHLRMLQWMDTLYRAMYLETRTELQDDIDLGKHLERVYRAMNQEGFFREASCQYTVQVVGEYYNHFAESVLVPNAKKACMECQNEFVMDYYAKMQDKCSMLESVEKDIANNGQWHAEKYSRKFWNCGGGRE